MTSIRTSNKFLINVFNNLQLQNDEIKETIEALNDSLDDNEEVYSAESKEKTKDIESKPAYFILLYPLGNHKIEKIVFKRLRLSTSTLLYLYEYYHNNIQ